jgi:FMN reductase
LTLPLTLSETGDTNMSTPRIVGISGSTRRPSRTRTLVETLAERVLDHRGAEIRIHDLVDIGPGLGAFSRDELPSAGERVLRDIETADGLIVATPVYNGSYAGLFKHVFDLLPPSALAGKPVLVAATGGGLRHALVVEHALRPLFGFFGAQTIPTSVYAGAEDFEDGLPVSKAVATRIAAAAREFALLLPQPANARHPALTDILSNA